MKVIYTIILALILMFIIMFSLENTADVQLKFYDYFRRSVPTYMLIFISFLAGVVFTGFMGIVERFRLTRTINRLNKTIRDLRREMKAADNPPYVEAVATSSQAPEENKS